MIKTSQISKLLFFTTLVTKLLVLPIILTSIAGRDSWFFVAIMHIFDIAILCIIIATLNKGGQRTLSEMLGGSAFAKIVAVLFAVFFLLKSLYPILEQELFLEDSLYDSLPSFEIFVPVLVLLGFAAIKSAKVFGRCAEMFFIPALVSAVILLFLAVPSADFSELLPFMYDGIKPFFKALVSISFFGDFIIIYVFFGQIVKDKPYCNWIGYAFMIMLFCLAFFAVYTAIFGDVAFRQVFALSKISKFNVIITSLGRFDWIAILVLLCGMLIHCALMIFAASQMLVSVFSCVKRKHFVFGLLVFVAIMLLIYNYNFADLAKIYQNIFVYFFAFMQYLMPIIIFFAAKREVKIEK